MKINNLLTNNSEDVDVVMPMYNLIDYSKHFSKTSGTLRNYTRDVSVDPIANSQSFIYKPSITEKTDNDGNAK